MADNRLALALSALALIAAAAGPNAARAVDINMADAVNHKILRVCGIRGHLPYSNERGEGFENKIAAIIAADLGIPVVYNWDTLGPGHVERTLDEKLCDVIPGVVQTEPTTLNTNHYYRTSYVLAYRAGQGLDGVSTLADPRLAGKRIGVQVEVPPVGHVIKAGLMERAKLYPLWVDAQSGSPMRDMIRDVRSGEIAAAVLWGPDAGYFARRDGEELQLAPLIEDVPGTARLQYRITMGVRLGDSGWKRQLNQIIAKRRPEIQAVLHDYGVPLLDEANRLISSPEPVRPPQPAR